jgi:hypothetical protein
MGANKLAVPQLKTLVANLEECEENFTPLIKASTGRKPGIRIPAPIVTTMKSLPKVLAWFQKNKKVYEAFLATTEESKTRGAGG